MALQAIQAYLQNTYTIEREIGYGTYGKVYKAIDNGNYEEVAIKEVPWDFTDLPDAVRLLREIAILRNLSHPNIIEIKDIKGPND
jgi:serine/threonine protein kinase